MKKPKKMEMALRGDSTFAKPSPDGVHNLIFCSETKELLYKEVMLAPKHLLPDTVCDSLLYLITNGLSLPEATKKLEIADDVLTSSLLEPSFKAKLKKAISLRNLYLSEKFYDTEVVPLLKQQVMEENELSTREKLDNLHLKQKIVDTACPHKEDKAQTPENSNFFHLNIQLPDTKESVLDGFKPTVSPEGEIIMDNTQNDWTHP